MLHITQLYVVALATGICSAFFSITYQSYLPVIVAKDRLTDGNTKLEFSNSERASPAGGSIAFVASPAEAIGIGALISALAALWLLPLRETA